MRMDARFQRGQPGLSCQSQSALVLGFPGAQGQLRSSQFPAQLIEGNVNDPHQQCEEDRLPETDDKDSLQRGPWLQSQSKHESACDQRAAGADQRECRNEYAPLQKPASFTDSRP